MAVDNRPFKSKEQDGQGNEIIIRDQQLVEQGTETTMASGACFETRDVDDRPVKIPRDNMMNIVLECIGIILNDSSRNLGTNVQKALGLQGNTVGHSTVANFASVLGVNSFASGFVLCDWANYSLAYDSYLDTGIKTGLIIATDRSNDAYAQVWFIQGGTINQVADGGGSIGFDKSIELVNRNGTAQFHWRTVNMNILTGFWIGMHY